MDYEFKSKITYFQCFVLHYRLLYSEMQQCIDYSTGGAATSPFLGIPLIS